MPVTCISQPIIVRMLHPAIILMFIHVVILPIFSHSHPYCYHILLCSASICITFVSRPIYSHFPMISFTQYVLIWTITSIINQSFTCIWYNILIMHGRGWGWTECKIIRNFGLWYKKLLAFHSMSCFHAMNIYTAKKNVQRILNRSESNTKYSQHLQS